MYAAGHPWLPPFELGTFLENEPMHWATPDKLPGIAMLGTGDQVKYFRAKAGEDYIARHTAVGAIASLKMEMEQLVVGARAATPGTTLDYARFDCAACHHELLIDGNGSPRQRAFKGKSYVPGRPPLKSWTAALPDVVVEALGDPAKRAAFDQAFRKVQAAATDKPFGNPALLATAASEMMKWCDDFLATVNVDNDALTFDKPTVDKLRAAIEQRRAGAAADPEAFAQLLWASHALTEPGQRKALADKYSGFKFDVRAGQVDWLKEFSAPEKWAEWGKK
jgi:hypothetical protein